MCFTCSYYPSTSGWLLVHIFKSTSQISVISDQNDDVNFRSRSLMKQLYSLWSLKVLSWKCFSAYLALPSDFDAVKWSHFENWSGYVVLEAKYSFYFRNWDMKLRDTPSHRLLASSTTYRPTNGFFYIDDSLSHPSIFLLASRTLFLLQSNIRNVFDYFQCSDDEDWWADVRMDFTASDACFTLSKNYNSTLYSTMGCELSHICFQTFRYWSNVIMSSCVVKPRSVVDIRGPIIDTLFSQRDSSKYACGARYWAFLRTSIVQFFGWSRKFLNATKYSAMLSCGLFDFITIKIDCLGLKMFKNCTKDF